MTPKEFIEEVHASPLIPVDFDEKYRIFRGYQELAQNTLDEFKRVCEKNDIFYRLTFGSLLGAIRDDGPIPWDYDIDVFVSFFDRPKLIEVLRRDLSDSYYFISYETDSHYSRNILRVTPKGYDSEVLHVDVFFFTGAPDDDFELKQIADELTKITRLRYDKFVNLKEASHGRIKWLLAVAIRKLKASFYSNKKLIARYEELSMKYNPRDTKRAIDTTLSANQRIYDAKGLYEVQSYKTMCGEYLIPKGYNEILKLVYGDYFQLPPLKNRLNEFLKSYEELEKRKR